MATREVVISFAASAIFNKDIDMRCMEQFIKILEILLYVWLVMFFINLVAHYG